MTATWPLGTTFEITSQFGNETWRVEKQADVRRNGISPDATLGKSLLRGVRGKRYNYQGQDGTRYEYQLLAIRPPGTTETAVSPLQYWLQKYRADRRGIRHNAQMREVCLRCGSQQVIAKGAGSVGQRYLRICKKERCGNTWYVNRCWRCRAPIDSRDSENPRCPKCSLFKCASCGACVCDKAKASGWTES